MPIYFWVVGRHPARDLKLVMMICPVIVCQMAGCDWDDDACYDRKNHVDTRTYEYTLPPLSS